MFLWAWLPSLQRFVATIERRAPVAAERTLDEQLTDGRRRHAEQQAHEAEEEASERQREENEDGVQADRLTYDPRTDDRCFEQLGGPVHHRHLQERDEHATADQCDEDRR